MNLKVVTSRSKAMQGVCFENAVARVGSRIAGKLKVDENCIVTVTAGAGG